MAEKPNFGEQVKEASRDKVLAKEELKSMLTDEQQVAALQKRGSEARNAFLKLSEAERKEFQKELGMKESEVDGDFGPNTLDHMFLAAGMPEKVVLEKNKLKGKTDAKVETSEKSEKFPPYNPNLSPEQQKEHAKIVEKRFQKFCEYHSASGDMQVPGQSNPNLRTPDPEYFKRIFDYHRGIAKMLPPFESLTKYLTQYGLTTVIASTARLYGNTEGFKDSPQELASDIEWYAETVDEKQLRNDKGALYLKDWKPFTGYVKNDKQKVPVRNGKKFEAS